MKGLGIDLCSIAKMNRILDKTPRFSERVFTPEERHYLSGRGAMEAESAAAMFAAKEAFLKAIGTGIGGEVRLCDISVHHEESGRPVYHLLPPAEESLRQIGASCAFLSLSHEEGMAAAVCVLE